MRGDPGGDHKENTGLTARPRLTREALDLIMQGCSGSISMTAAKRLEQEILALWEWQDKVLEAHREIAFNAAAHRQALIDHEATQSAWGGRLKCLMETP
jgi:hypothetical protein